MTTGVSGVKLGLGSGRRNVHIGETVMKGTPMHTQNPFLNDLSKLATGAAGAFQGMKQEMEAMVRQRVERILADLDLVPREEFEAVKDMAREARLENEALRKRIEALETPARPKAAPRKTTAKKA
jgi:BMFP domain-containing protein YqiC